MFDSSIGRPQADVELADVVRRFGPQYTAQHGQTMTERTGQALHDAEGEDVNTPRCPHCGSNRTRLLGEYPRFGTP
jgi:hypothetical protein